MTQADKIREFVKKNYIDPARQSGQKTVTVRASEIHKAMGLEKRFPAICGAIDTDKFIKFASVVLYKRTGPLQSSTVLWTFDLLNENKIKIDQ